MTKNGTGSGKVLGITLENFQSHVNTDIELHPGVNAIVGLSDSGKSALLRAFNWVRTNRPSGDAFMRTGAKMVAVDIEFDDGVVVSREKGSDNSYIISQVGVKPQEFRGFGSSVPEPVVDVMELDDVNVQAQLDAPFLLADSAGEVAKKLNRVANLHKIDHAQSSVRKRLMSIKQSIKNEEGREAELSAEIEALGFIDAAERDLASLENRARHLANKSGERSRLSKVVSQAQSARATIEELQEFLKVADVAQPVFDAHAQLEEAREERKKLKRALLDIGVIAMRCDRALARHVEAQKEFDHLMPDVCPLCGGARPQDGWL